MNENKPKIKVGKNGPYLVNGNVPLIEESTVIGADAEPEKWIKTNSYPQQENCSLCRCGASQNKPFCDGTHTAINFDGTETAAKEANTLKKEKTRGKTINITYIESFCSIARFCHAAGDAWHLVKHSDNPESKAKVLEEAANCPSGALEAWEKSGQIIEPTLNQEISVTEKPSGPLWIKGGIEIEAADGQVYEKRNRVTLCRCGKSQNKPFCDGKHVVDVS